MKRFLVIALIAGAAVVLGGRWSAHLRLLSQRRSEAAGVQAVEAALARRVSTASIASPRCNLRDALQHLAAHCQVPLKIDRSETDRISPLSLTRIDLPDGEFTIEELLYLVTGRAALGWHRVGDSIVITSQDEVEPSDKPFTRVYALPAGSAAGDPLTDDAEELRKLIVTAVERDSWKDAGGSGVILTAGGALIVHHTPKIHRLVQSLLARMESLPGGPPRSFPLEDLPVEEESVRRKLDCADSVEFVDEPLDRALETISQRHQLPIVLQRRVLAELGIPLDTPVTLTMHDVSLGTILHTLLTELWLGYYIAGDTVVVADPPCCESCCTWFYEVRDLCDAQSRPGFDDLIELITTAVAPDSWDDVGGPGTMATLSGGWLVVTQTPEVQRQVRQVLSRLRAILNPGCDLDHLWLSPADDISLVLEQALDREVTLKYADLPLREVCNDLARRLGIPVMPQRRMLADAGIALDTSVTIDLPSLPVRQALALLLEQYKLTFDPRGEVIRVTTPEDAERDLVTRIIDVRHLVDPVSGGMDEDTLIDLITTCVAPDSWDEVGGPGSEKIFRGLLVFHQTYEISRQVQQLIDALSEHCLPSQLDVAAVQSTAQKKPVWVNLTEREQSILRKMGAPANLHAKNARIKDALVELCTQAAIPVHFDRLWYEDAGLENGTFHFELSFDQVPLREILTQIEAKKAVGFVIAHGMLVVTDPQEADRYLVLRLYPLGRRATDDTSFKAEAVADLITRRIEPNMWDEHGGLGIIEAVNDDWLLVVQTLPMHRRVEEALAKLRNGEMLPLSPQLQKFIDGMRAVEKLMEGRQAPDDVFIGYPPSWPRQAK